MEKKKLDEVYDKYLWDFYDYEAKANQNTEKYTKIKSLFWGNTDAHL